MLDSLRLRGRAEKPSEHLIEALGVRAGLIRLRVRLALLLGGGHVERISERLSRFPEVREPTPEMIESAYGIVFGFNRDFDFPGDTAARIYLEMEKVRVAEESVRNHVEHVVAE